MPGAGSYTLPSHISSGLKIGIHGKTDFIDQNVKKGVPGPGQYDMQNSTGNKNYRAPAYSLGNGSRNDLSKSMQVPGPGNYSCTNFGVSKKSAPMYGFGTDI